MSADAGTEHVCGIHPVVEALRARRRRLVRLRLRADSRRPELDAVREAALAAGVPVEEVGAERLRAGAAGQGVELEAGPLPELSLPELIAGKAAPRTLVALDGVEDPQNLGAIARAAEAAGVQGLLLTRRRAPPLSPAVSRASAGAIEWLPAARVANLSRALDQLKSRGFWVFGAVSDEAEDAFGLAERTVRGDRVLVLGAEGRGLRPGTLRVVDHRVKIPMDGRIGSLNVGAAAAVLLFELRRRSRLATSP